MADHFQSSGNEMQQDSWELLAPNFHPPLCSFMGPRSSYIQSDPGGAGGAAGGGRAASGDGSSLLDLPHVGLFGLMESNADNSILIDSNPFDLCMQQSVHYKQGGELERRQLSLPAPPPQPPRRTNQQNYIIPTSRQLSRSVPSSPTFSASRLQANPAASMIGGGGSSVAAPGRLPTVAKNLSAHLNASQQVSSSASVLTASLDLACCASNLVSPSPGSVRSASFSSDQAAAATASSFNSDHAANSTNFSCDQATVGRTTNFTSDHEARSANLGSDQSSAATLASFSNDQAARSASFSELAAAASLFVAGFPSTPASSTTNLNATAAEQDHGLQAAAPSGSAFTAKKRRLQGVKISKGDQDELAATQDSLADVLPFMQGGANMDTTPSEPEISNNSANIEGKESTMKVNSSITSSSACMKTQVLEGTPPPKQDYIHVRARRGQATDSHSLAERVRREKISERMKFLQDLVPGCNKITGKAVMLDEIINYVQSLQRQVEFLSMKLSAVSPQTSKFEANHLINHAEPRPIQIGTTLHFNQVENHAHLQHDVHLSMPLLLDVQQQAPQHQQQSSNMDVAQAWEDELQSLVHTGFSTLP